MDVITVFGELYRNKVTAKEQVYRLTVDSGEVEPTPGWYSLVKCDDRWKLQRILSKSRAKIYPGWID